jgi:hypothetical protein
MESPKCQNCGDNGIVYWEYDIIVGYDEDGTPIGGKDWAHDFCDCEIGKELKASS